MSAFVKATSGLRVRVAQARDDVIAHVRVWVPRRVSSRAEVDRLQRRWQYLQSVVAAADVKEIRGALACGVARSREQLLEAAHVDVLRELIELAREVDPRFEARRA